MKLLIVGIDGATFDLVRPWAEQGHLPNLARLMADQQKATQQEIQQAFMDYHVRGRKRRFAWKEVLATLQDERKPASPPSAARPASSAGSTTTPASP